MRILISNDDGYFSPGIKLLAERLAEFGEITIVAPERDRSGASNSLTLDRPLVVRETAKGVFSVNGTPTDCVHIAVTGLLDFVPDMVVSGINDGANMGDDTIYSGTVAAAMEGFLLGIPSIALSLAKKGGNQYETAATIARGLVERFKRAPIQQPVLLNVTCRTSRTPSSPESRLRASAGATRPSPSSSCELPRGDTAYWIGPAGGAQDAGPGTDFFAVEHGRVSITPLQVDLTFPGQLALVKDWLER
jgi:5'-nucleotidase